MKHSASVLLNRLLARGKFRHVQILLELAELGSVQRAADAIGMTQSSVTQSLAYLEALLETQLFQRHARGVRPTPACTDLLPIARQVLLGVADGAEVISARHNQGEGVVRFIASIAATQGLLVNALPGFHDQAPGIQVQLREAEGEEQLLAIAHGEVDLVACRRPAVIPEGWQFHALLEDRFAIVCRADNPIASARTVKWDELARQTWLMLPVGVAARERFDEFASRLPRAPKVYPLVTRSPTMMWSLMRQRSLVALLPLNLVRPLLESGELAELRMANLAPMEPLGLLQPEAGLAHAADRLSVYLRERSAAGRELQ